jgi:hypothetical protein
MVLVGVCICSLEREEDIVAIEVVSHDDANPERAFRPMV